MSSENQNEPLDLKVLFQQYLSHWWLFVACVVVCVGLGVFYNKIHQPDYSVHANILIAQEDGKGGSSFMRSAFGDLAGLFGTAGNVDDEVFVVGSHSVLREVARDLGMERRHSVRGLPLQWRFAYKEFPVEVIMPEGLCDTLSVPLTFRIHVGKSGKTSIKAYAKNTKILKEKNLTLPFTIQTEYGEFTFVKTPYFTPDETINTRIKVTGFNALAEQMGKDIHIGIPSKKANVIALNTVSTDAQFAKDLLNKIIENYNQRSVDDRNIQNEKTAAFIDGRLELLTGALDSAERSIEQFKESQGITQLDVDAQYQFTRKSALESSLVEAQAQELMIADLKSYLEKPSNQYEMLPVVQDRKLSPEVIGAYNNLILQRMKMVSAGTTGGLALKKLDEQIAAQHANVMESIDQALQAASLTVRQLKAKMSEADSQLDRLPSQERIYMNLLRDQRLKEELYLFLLQNREETAISLANNTPKGIVIDYAYSDSAPRGLGSKKVLMLAFVLGLLLAPAILYTRDRFRSHFDTFQELQKLTKVPMLGEVCISRSKSPLVVKPGGSTSAAELFRLIRTNLQFVLSDKGDRVVLVTSTRSGEGKSFVSINLASSLALLKKRVVLLGMDIRAPQLAAYLGLPPHTGITEYLSNPGLTLDDILMRDPLGNGLDIIVAGPVPPNPSELLLSNRVDELFEQLRQDYDYVIVDSAPVGMVSDTFSLVRISDATVYVCRAKYTSFTDVRYFNDIYKDERLHKMSLVVNGTTAKSGYGYGYGHKDKDE